MALVPLVIDLMKKGAPMAKQAIDAVMTKITGEDANSGSDEDMSFNGSRSYNDSMNISDSSNTESKGFIAATKDNTAAVFEKYKFVRRAIVFALLCLLSYLVWAVVTVYLNTGLVAQGMVDIIEIFCGILTIFACYYTYSRAKECNTKTMHTRIESFDGQSQDYDRSRRQQDAPMNQDAPGPEGGEHEPYDGNEPPHDNDEVHMS